MTFLSRQSIGEIIRTARTEREMSQQQVAILVQHHFPGVTCSQWTLSLIESGRQEISLSQLGAIASVLEVPVARFLKEEAPLST